MSNFKANPKIKISNRETGFNPSPPTMLHVDLNSCFATVEQQANPLLRGRPVAVAAYTTGSGCILAASVEAKRQGVATGMRVRDGKRLCPALTVLPSDPWKYRFVNRKLLSLFRQYTADVEVKSIDEMVLRLDRTPALEKRVSQFSQGRLKHSLHSDIAAAMMAIGREIKERIKAEIGEWLTVSVGISTNRYLAKIASGLHKPDGLDIIDRFTIEAVLGKMDLEDLTGIKRGYGGRLRYHGITTPLALYRASPGTVERAFHSVVGYHWSLWLHGYETEKPFGRKADQKSFGHSYALYKPYTPRDRELGQILCELSAKMGRRLRADGFRARGIHVSCLFSNDTFWHTGHKLPEAVFADADLYQRALRLLSGAPVRPVRIIAVSCFALTPDLYGQKSLFSGDNRKEDLTRAVDAISGRWGEFAVFPARMLRMEQKIMDRIAFGGVAGLEEEIPSVR
ncbi:hypothetical protein M1555_02175 [Patescibacteria group bacterium]|nr:hypothetical protein [Patescibacteria group bacterium]